MAPGRLSSFALLLGSLELQYIWYIAIVNGQTRVPNSGIFLLLLNCFCFISFFWWERIEGKREGGTEGESEEERKGGKKGTQL